MHPCTGSALDIFLALKPYGSIVESLDQSGFYKLLGLNIMWKCQLVMRNQRRDNTI